MYFAWWGSQALIKQHERLVEVAEALVVGKPEVPVKEADELFFCGFAAYLHDVSRPGEGVCDCAAQVFCGILAQIFSPLTVSLPNH